MVTGAGTPAATLAGVDRLTLPSAGLEIGGRAERSETLLAYAGAFQLTLSTAVPDRGVQLHSSYLGHPDVERTSAAHLWIAAGGPRLWTAEHDAADLPVAHGRRRCLLDHLSVLANELRAMTDGEVTLDVPAAGLVQLDEA